MGSFLFFARRKLGRRGGIADCVPRLEYKCRHAAFVVENACNLRRLADWDFCLGDICGNDLIRQLGEELTGSGQL
jgi:hypothetical protein